jgi:protein TonB
VTLAWPERSEPVAPLPVAAVRVPDADPLVLPPEVTIGLPPTTAALRFDPRVPTVPHGPGDAVGAPRDSRDPWSAALVDEQPALLAGPTPLYPESLRRAGIAGRVVVEAVLDTLGHAEPGSVRTVTSPDPGFVAPARHYVLQAVFRPARVHGHAVRVLVRVPIDFTLAGLQ